MTQLQSFLNNLFNALLLSFRFRNLSLALRTLSLHGQKPKRSNLLLPLSFEVVLMSLSNQMVRIERESSVILAKESKMNVN